MKKTGTLVLEGTTYDVELTARPAYTPDSSDTDVRTRRPRMSFPKYVKQGNKRRLNSVFMMENPRSIDPTKGLYSVDYITNADIPNATTSQEDSMIKTVTSRAEDPTEAVFGLDLHGNVVHKCISDGPHWIVCGQTGSGKSVFMNQILVTMMSHTTPDELKIIWVDPKKVEAGAYKGSPFCPIDPVTDMNDAYGLMLYLAWEMDRRYDDLESVGVKNLMEFNEWVDKHPDEAKERGLEKMPFFVCIIDEYADMVAQNKEVEAPIIRLGQKARAAGLHLLIATQRPSASILSPSLKANVPSRVCMRVADSTNSMIVMDEPGGEKLRGYGDCYIKDKAGNMTRCQGAFIENDEIDRIFDDLKDTYGSPDTIDYKQIAVDQGLCEWAGDYDEDTPWKDKHLKAIKKRPGRP